MDSQFLIVLLICLAWVLGSTLFFTISGRNKKITVRYPHGDPFKKPEGVIDYPRTLEIILVESSTHQIATEIYADLVIRYEDLINGTYTIPEKFRTSVTEAKEEEIKEGIIEANESPETEFEFENNGISDEEIGDLLNQINMPIENESIEKEEEPLIFEIPEENTSSISIEEEIKEDGREEKKPKDDSYINPANYQSDF